MTQWMWWSGWFISTLWRRWTTRRGKDGRKGHQIGRWMHSISRNMWTFSSAQLWGLDGYWVRFVTKIFCPWCKFLQKHSFFVFLSLKMLKFNEIKSVKTLIWKSGGVRFLTNLMSGWISSSLLCIYFFSLTHHMTMFKWRVCGPYCEDALGIVSIGRLFPLYIHTNYLILNTSTPMLIPWHIFENICCVSLESCLWAFSMLSELIPKVSDSWACTMYFKDIHAMQHLHIQNKHIYSESALVDVSVIWFTLWNTQIKQLWPDYGLLTLCPLWRFTSEVDFFKFSHLLGATSIFNFFQLQFFFQHLFHKITISSKSEFKMGWSNIKS